MQSLFRIDPSLPEEHIHRLFSQKATEEKVSEFQKLVCTSLENHGLNDIAKEISDNYKKEVDKHVEISKNLVTEAFNEWTPPLYSVMDLKQRFENSFMEKKRMEKEKQNEVYRIRAEWRRNNFQGEPVLPPALQPITVENTSKYCTFEEEKINYGKDPLTGQVMTRPLKWSYLVTLEMFKDQFYYYGNSGIINTGKSFAAIITEATRCGLDEKQLAKALTLCIAEIFPAVKELAESHKDNVAELINCIRNQMTNRNELLQVQNKLSCIRRSPRDPVINTLQGVAQLFDAFQTISGTDKTEEMRKADIDSVQKMTLLFVISSKTRAKLQDSIQAKKGDMKLSEQISEVNVMELNEDYQI